MSEWQPIETAPIDEPILLFGRIDPRSEFDLLKWDVPCVFSGYYDTIDEAWVPHGGTWLGPFMEVTHWMSLPPEPVQEMHKLNTSLQKVQTTQDGTNED